jgi:DNA polymerase-3 subunit delta
MEVKTLKDFASTVKSDSISGGILVYGQEKHFIKDSINLIYKKVKDFPEINIIELDGENVTIDSIVNACETITFMSSKKVVHIKEPFFLEKENDSQSKEIIDKLSKYVVHLPENVILLISYAGDINEKNALLKVIRATGIVADYRTLKGEALQKWVQEIFKKNGKQISKSDLIYFISEVGNSTEQLLREIEKICAYAIDEEVITRNSIDSIVHKSLESNIFKMVDSISKKDVESSISILNVLLFQKEDYGKILGMIIRQFRLLYQIKLLLNDKKDINEMKKRLNLNNEYVLQNMIKQARPYNEQALKKALDTCLETDFKVKSGKISPELALEMLIANLCK